MIIRTPGRRGDEDRSSRFIGLVIAAGLAIPCFAAFSHAGETGRTPLVFAPVRNYPDPVNAYTKIEYDLDSAGPVSLKVYNLLGQEVATLVDRRQVAGRYFIPLTAFNLSSGVYFYRLEAGSVVTTHRLVLIQ